MRDDEDKAFLPDESLAFRTTFFANHAEEPWHTSICVQLPTEQV